MIFDAPSSWIISILVGIIIIVMVSSFFAYLCGCCKKIPNRDELLGLSGVVKITNPDTEKNNTPVALSMTRRHSDDNIPILSVLSSSSSAKRMNGIGNNTCNPGSATRSLPELPVDATVPATSNRNGQNEGNFIGCNGVSDTNSDLYATLEEHKVGTSVIPKSKIPPNDKMYASTLSSSAVATYEQIDEDPTYNKVKREHPYAQVFENDATSSSYDSEQSPSELRNVSAIDEVDGPINIPAASAITGGVAASNDLPYMTPPLHAEHFSGDSQDSAKGYTSITVREPLAHIRTSNTTKRNTFDSHYTVLSDDSDEMYAAIQEAYTSGSETYAQIQPLPSANPTYCSVPETVSEASSSQKFGSTVHSRQASTSSIASSLTNRHSPKEKRQANSPLPKPPDLSPDDMYAKVLKKRRNDDCCNSRDSVYNSDPDNASSLNLHAGPSSMIEKLDYREDVADGIERRLSVEVEDSDRYACGYETLPERNYEMLEEINSSLCYETVKETFQRNSGYESLPEPDSLSPGYERIQEPNGGYEKIKYASKEDESDPNYEELKPQVNDEQFHCYATINKKKNTNSERSTEPDYASLTRRANNEEYENGMENDPFYERIRRQQSSQNESEGEMNNNNSTNTSSNKVSDVSKQDSVSETNVNDLYSKVNKNVKR